MLAEGREGTVPGAHRSPPAPMPPLSRAGRRGLEGARAARNHPRPPWCVPGSLAAPGVHPRLPGRCPGRRTRSGGREALVRERALLLLQDLLLVLVDTPLLTQTHSLRTRKQQHREHFLCKYSPVPSTDAEAHVCDRHPHTNTHTDVQQGSLSG